MPTANLDKVLQAFYTKLVRTAILNEPLVIDRHRAYELIEAAKGDVYAQIMGLLASPEYKQAIEDALEARREVA